MSYTPTHSIDEITRKVWEYTTRTLTEFPPMPCKNVVSVYDATVPAGGSLTVDVNDPGLWYVWCAMYPSFSVVLEESDDGSTYTRVHRTKWPSHTFSIELLFSFSKPYNRITVLNGSSTSDGSLSLWGCKLS